MPEVSKARIRIGIRVVSTTGRALSSIMESMKLFVPLLVLGSSCVCALSLVAADTAVVEEIVAKCNGDIVTRGDLDRSRRELMETLRESGVVGDELEKQLAEREKDLLRDRIDQLILAQKAKDLNINVDSEVSKQMSAIQSDSKIADPEKFQAYIKERSGMSYEDFKQEMKNRFLTQRVIREEVSEKMSVKHEDVEKYYNEHKTEFVRDEQITLQEILISTEGKDAAGVAAAEKKAKDLVARARKGERFAEMARDNSDSVTAKGMGELPPYKKGMLSSNLEDAVWNQPKGYITDPIRTDNGFLDSARRRSPEGRPSRAVRSGEPNQRDTARAQAGRRRSRIPHQAAQGRFPRDQGRLHRYRRGGRQGHCVGGSRAAQTRNSEEGRGCEHHSAQEAAVEHPGSRDPNHGYQFVAVGGVRFP